MEITRDFVHDKSTKNTHRFKEVEEDGQVLAVGQLYVRKEVLGDSPPSRLSLIILMEGEEE